MESFVIDREFVKFEIPASQSTTGKDQNVVLSSNRLVGQIKPKNEKDDNWVVIRSKIARHAMVLMSRLLSSRISRGSISADIAVSDWAHGWENYIKSDASVQDGDAPISVYTSKGLKWGSGIHPDFVSLEEEVQGRDVSNERLQAFAKKHYNLSGAVQMQYDTKRAVVMTRSRRGDAKVTMWNRDIRFGGESVTFIVPGDADVESDIVSVDLAAKLTELLDGISMFTVLRHKLLEEQDAEYVKRRKTALGLNREALVNLKSMIERQVAASNIDFFPKMPNIEIPE